MPNLKKSIYFTICGEEICLDVTFHLLDKAERAFSPFSIDAIPFFLQDALKVQRNKIADLMSLWAQEKTKLTRDEIREHYFTCPQVEFIKTIGKIQACICWSLRDGDGQPMITDAAFEKLANGIDLDASDIKKPSQKSEASDKPKKIRAAISKPR